MGPFSVQKWYIKGKRLNFQVEPGTSLLRLRSSADILVLGSKRTQRITGSAFRIFFQPNWQIGNGIFNRPIMERTQMLVTGEPGPR